MNYYLDCEFNEYVSEGILHIELISIGIISEDNRELYRINQIPESSIKQANIWVKRNVLNTLYICDTVAYSNELGGETLYRLDHYIKSDLEKYYKSLDQIKQDIIDFIGIDSNPKFWGEWSSYDWCCLCSCFGSMIDLPSNFPMRCRDIIQLAEDHLNISSKELPESLETDGNHNALEGAKTVKMRYEWLLDRIQRPVR